MGFLSLFSRKSNTERQQTKRLVKAQAYDDTVASLPPTKGIYPMAGNGTNAIEAMSRSPRFNSSHLSLAESAAPAPVPAPAPSPTVARFKDESLERPRTAPNGARSLTDWAKASPRKRDSLRRPPVSFRKPPVGPVPAPQKKTGSETQEPTDTAKGESTKIFVDLLDAQSEISPADFHSRVRAAGARNYGEDVADRNIGENGVNLDSSHVQAFYASSVQTPRPKTSRDVSERAGVRRVYPSAAHPHVTKTISVESGLRTKSLNSSNGFHIFPRRVPSPLSPQSPPLPTEPPPPNPSRSLRRLTLNAYLPSIQTNGEKSPQMKTRPKSFHRGLGIRDNKSDVAPERPDHRHPRQGTDSPDLGGNSPKLWRSIKSERPAIPQIDLAMLAKGRRRAASSGLDRAERAPAEQPFQLNDVPRPTSAMSSRRGPVASTAFTSPGKRPSKRQGTHALHSSISSVQSHDTATGLTPPKQPMKTTRNVKPDVEGGSVFPLVKAVDHPLSNSREEPYDYPRTRSLMAPPKARLDEIEEYVPMRSSSIRHWSISSTTPTTASSSDQTFPRPTSRHTPNTSVDLNTVSGLPSSRSSIRSAFAQDSFCTAPESVVNSPKKTKSPGFNMDDYLSSDDDSFTSPRRPRGEGEESLLFCDDGYGNGAQLPGLDDSLAAPAPSVLSRSPRSSLSLPSGRLRQAYTSPLMGGGAFPLPQRRYVLDTPLDYDCDYVDEHYSTDGDDLLASNYLTPGQLRRGMRRISALGMPYGYGLGFGYGGLEDDVIEEERLEKIDIATAVRMRKEAKARKRALALTATKRRTLPLPQGRVAKGKGIARDVEYEECHADVE